MKKHGSKLLSLTTLLCLSTAASATVGNNNFEARFEMGHPTIDRGMLSGDRWNQRNPSLVNDGSLIVQRNGAPPNAFIPVTAHGLPLPGSYHTRSGNLSFTPDPTFFGTPSHPASDIVVYDPSFPSEFTSQSLPFPGQVHANGMTFVPPPANGFPSLAKSNIKPPVCEFIAYDTYVDKNQPYMANISRNNFHGYQYSTNSASDFRFTPPPFIVANESPEFSLRPVGSFFPICNGANGCGEDILIFNDDGSIVYMPRNDLEGPTTFPQANFGVDSGDKMMRFDKKRSYHIAQANKAIEHIQDLANGQNVDPEEFNSTINIDQSGTPVPRERDSVTVQTPEPLNATDREILNTLKRARELTSLGMTRQLTPEESTEARGLRRQLRNYGTRRVDEAVNKQRAIEEFKTQQKKKPGTKPPSTATKQPPALTPIEQSIIHLLQRSRELTSLGMSRQLTPEEAAEARTLRRTLRGFGTNAVDTAARKQRALDAYKERQSATNKSNTRPRVPKPAPLTGEEKEILGWLDRMKALTSTAMTRKLTTSENKEMRALKSKLDDKPRKVVDSAMSKRMAANGHNPSVINTPNAPSLGQPGSKTGGGVHPKVKRRTEQNLLRDK